MRKLDLAWLVGVGVDSKTWYWLRRRYLGLMAKRVALGYLIIGVFADIEIDEIGE